MSNSTNLRILIIDDNPDIHQDFLKILAGESSQEKKLKNAEQLIFGDKPDKCQLPEFAIDTASQGQEGVKCVAKAIIEGKPYALAFVDIRMPPGWDGIETIKRIWELDNDMQIVICTAYSDYSWEETIGQLGQRDNLLILKKPFDNDSVRQLSMALTKKWQSTREASEYTKHLASSHTLLENKIQYDISHDTLTKLPNKKFLMDYMHQELLNATKTHSSTAIIYFNLDRLKLINDSFSYSAGDALLKHISETIREGIAKNILVAKLGADEFVFVVSDFKSVEEIKEITQVLLSKFKSPFTVNDHDIIISPSIGVSIFPENGKDIDELILNAGLALNYAKKLGGGQVQFYTKELKEESLKRLQMETDLHRAIDNDEFFLCYQPQYSLDNNKLVSVEALIRWQHPQKGEISPIDFIPLVEEIDLMPALSEKVLKIACQQNKDWQDRGLPPIRMAVNLSAQEFKQPNFVEKIEKILKETELKPEYLEIEVTERIIVNSSESINKITKLKELGISIAVDDFGTGYSSLNYLSKIPFSRLKIDQSFIHNIGTNKSDEAIIQAIITLAKELNLVVIAEGIETQEQLDFLKSRKCDEVQGYYFSKPLETAQLEALLKNSQ